jgi:hypothetical protein
MTINVFTGQNPFGTLDKALWNPGIITPLTVDFLSVAVPLALNTKVGTNFVNKQVRKILDKNLPENIEIEAEIKKLKMFQIEAGMLDSDNFGVRFEAAINFGGLTGWGANSFFSFLGLNPYSINLLNRSQYNAYLGIYLNSFHSAYIP